MYSETTLRQHNLTLPQKERKWICHLLLLWCQPSLVLARWMREPSQLKNNSEELLIFIVLNDNCCVAAQMFTSTQRQSGADTENTLLMAGGVWTVSFGGHVISQDLTVCPIHCVSFQVDSRPYLMFPEIIFIPEIGNKFCIYFKTSHTASYWKSFSNTSTIFPIISVAKK